jgi:hypothetical protein
MSGGPQTLESRINTRDRGVFRVWANSQQSSHKKGVLMRSRSARRFLRPGGVPCLLFLTKPIRFGSPRVTNARRMASPRPRRVLTRTPHRHITPPIPRFPPHRRGASRARRIVHVSSAHGGVSQSVARHITSARTDSRGRRRRTSTSPPRASALASRSSPRAAMERTWGRRAGGFGSRRARGDRSASAGSGAADETRDA